jgi:type IV pilus assembly protein PilY1
MMNYLTAASTSDLTGGGGLTAADRYQVLTGGGYAPTPVPVSVQIGGNTYQAAVSGTNVFTPSGPTLGRRYRTYWHGIID